MAEVCVHDDRDVIFFQDLDHGIVLVHAHHFFAVVEGAADDEALRGFEPAAVLHVPEGSAHVEDAEVAGLQEPDDAVVGIALLEVFHLVVAGAREDGQKIHVSSQKTAGHIDLRLLQFLRILDQNGLLGGVVGQERVLFVLQALDLPHAVGADLIDFTGEQAEGVGQHRVPGLHAEGRRAGTVDGGGVTEGRQEEAEIRVVGEAHEPLGLRLPDPVKVHIVQGRAHQLPAAAGDNGVHFGIGEEIIRFGTAGLRRIADADTAALKAVGPELQLKAGALKDIQGIQEGGVIRFGGSTEGRGDEAQRPVFRKIVRIAHGSFLSLMK